MWPPCPRGPEASETAAAMSTWAGQPVLTGPRHHCTWETPGRKGTIVPNSRVLREDISFGGNRMDRKHLAWYSGRFDSFGAFRNPLPGAGVLPYGANVY